MNNITELFDRLLEQSGSIDMAESDFRHMMADDTTLRQQYQIWCEEQGYSEQHGFIDYCTDYIDRRENGWYIFQTDYEDI